MAHLLVLGGGFGGVAAAHELRAALSPGDEVTLVASSERFFVGFAKLWDLVGARPLSHGSARLSDLQRHRIRFLQADVTAIDPAALTVETTAGPQAGDGIIVALGAAHDPAHADLLAPDAWDLYRADDLPDMRADLARLEEGRLVLSILGVPYLCPPAPFEAALLLDEWLRAHGRREGVELVLSTPQPVTLPVAGPDASGYLAERLAERDVTLLTEHAVVGVDHAGRKIDFAGGRELRWDLLLGVPAAAPQPVVARSALAGDDGWVWPDPRTFATAYERVYAVGDCTAVPTATAQLPKAGVFAEAGGKVAARNLAADLLGTPRAEFDGRGHCFLELPGQQVARIGGDFYAEPSPDVSLGAPSAEAFALKQAWEQERLATWFN